MWQGVFVVSHEWSRAITGSTDTLVGAGFFDCEETTHRQEYRCYLRRLAQLAEHQLRNFLQRLKHSAAINRGRFNNRLALALKFFL